MKKTEVIEQLENLKSRAIAFLGEKHNQWDANDPMGLAETNLKALKIVEGIDYILSEIYFIPDDKEFELVRKEEFEKYRDISNLLKRKDVEAMAAKWRELFGNIENMEVIFNESSYKMAELSIYETPSVYVIYTEKI